MPVTKPGSRTGGQLLMDSLVGLGATRGFGVPGESYLAVLDAMVDHANVFNLVLCRQEGGAAYMAAGARSRTGASIAISTTGIAGPSGGTRSKPVGTVWVAAASSRGVSTRLLQLQGDRARIQRRAVAGALLLAWEHLGGYRARPLALTC